MDCSKKDKKSSSSSASAFFVDGFDGVAAMRDACGLRALRVLCAATHGA
eukprot:CAMPEP_0179685148 /NCGR_PEP_ID=MMETSP0936-20121108/954_1 /TAXON_ID=548131 ORGANISM="Ostreococcus mediterraneus, Strain clade-D-RCC2573" /NCGR_SAMPLE_ID=MMETSP0936 /ASSEMBLY_ACC=CAM_ASM_000574 /LENGTH=48 /DNA_ID= /DNA_START= /DNA_END= /DNA_ORIENTATION=